MTNRPLTKKELTNLEELRIETLTELNMITDDYKKMKNKSSFLKFYMFDWDDNLLVMDTKANLLKDGEIVTLSTKEYAELGKNQTEYEKYSYLDDSFIAFRDNNSFRRDFMNAITSKKIGKSWKALIKCILNANIFAIITNRGHDQHIIREAISWIINNIFSSREKEIFQKNLHKFVNIFDTYYPSGFDQSVNYYLDLCDFYCINSLYFLAQTGMTRFGDSNPSKKIRAVEMFANKAHNLSKLVNKKARLGFSDDDIRNFEAIRNYMKDDLSNKLNIDLIIYKTGEDEYTKHRI